MALVSRWDIREEAYSDGADVTSLTDRTGSTTLNSAIGTDLPTYNLSLDAIYFDGGDCLGSTSTAAALDAVPAGSAWSMFALIYQTSLAADYICGFGKGSSANQGLLLRTDASGNVRGFVRDNTDSTQQQVTSSATISTSTWTVVHFCLDGSGNIRVGWDGSNLSANTAMTEVPSGVTWDQFAIGAYARSTTGNHWTGYVREVRIYDSNEHANLATIVSDMKTPGGGSPTIVSVDDGTIVPGQANVACVTTNMGAGVAARIVSGTKTIPMTGYNASATAPDFDVPDLTAMMAAGIDIGTTVTLEIVS